ncbi:MAG: carbohydrate binding domain-containing protein [Armatimonadota bacterium]
MRKLAGLMPVLTFICLPFLSAALGAQEVNLVPDPSFEQGLEGWQAEQELQTDEAQAHTGRSYLFAEIDQPRQAKFLRRTFRLHQDRLYRLELWARSPERSKIAIWLDQGDNQQNLTHWQEIARRWQKYTIGFSPPSTGDWTLRIVAPSSHSARPGSMYLDDISLYETTLPPSTVLSDEDGFSDSPAIAVDGQGRIWAAWITFDGAQDNLWAAQVEMGRDGSIAVKEKWTVPTPAGAYLAHASLAGGPDRAHLVWAAEVNHDWRIYCTQMTQQGPGEPWPLEGSPFVECKPAVAAFRSGALAVWESNRSGAREILTGPLGRAFYFEGPRRLSAAGVNSYNPSIASNGAEAWAVWDSFRDGNYNLYGARLDGQGWHNEVQLTDNPWIEHRPKVAAGRDGFWVTWEASLFQRYKTNAFSTKRICLARLGPQGLEAPIGMLEGLAGWLERPNVMVDAQGRVWVVARKFRNRASGWETIAAAYTGRQWTPQQLVMVEAGRAWVPDLALVGDRLLVAAQTDNIPASYPTIEASRSTVADVRLAAVDVTEAPPAQTITLTDLAMPETDLNVPDERARRAEDAERYAIDYRGDQLQLYWGDFHDHSDVSVCNRRGDLAPDDNYAHNRDIHRLDFAAVTDHGYNLSPPMWHFLAKTARFNCEPERFVTFLAEEWTSTFEEYSDKYPDGFYGHRNLIFANPYFPNWYNARDRSTPRQLWDQLEKDGADFVHIPHQLADVGNVPTDWDFVDEEAQPVAEIFQTRGSYEYDGAPRMAGRAQAKGHFIQDAWARGVVIGVIASPDHGGGHGKAAVYAPRLTRDAILNGIRQRHCYGTTSAKIFLDVRVNGRLMGEKIARAQGPVTVQVEATAAGPIQRVDVVRNNEFVYTPKVEGRQVGFTYRDNQPLEGDSYYYVRVIQEDEEIAWSSPVWLTAG